MVELTSEQVQAKQLELQAMEQANSRQLQEALQTFGQALALWPDRASIYNNRAQTHRLLNQIEGKGYLKYYNIQTNLFHFRSKTRFEQGHFVE